MGFLKLFDPDQAPNYAANPSPGARMFVYGAGTDNLRPIYSDANLTITRGNPVVADEQGIFPTCFLLDGDYRLVIQNARGDLIEDQDNVSIHTPSELSASRRFDTVTDLVDDNVLSYQRAQGRHMVREGDTVQVDECALMYLVADAAEAAPHLTTQGGVKLMVLPSDAGSYPLAAFPGSFDEAMPKALAAGPVSLDAGRVYTSTTGISITDQPVQIIGNGAKIVRAANAQNAPILTIDHTLSTPVSVVSHTTCALWAGYPVASLSLAQTPSHGDTVTILGDTYRFATSLSQARDVLIGANVSATLDNLKAAILADPSQAGTAFDAATTAHTGVTATTTGSALEVTACHQIVADDYWTFASSNGNATWTKQNSSTIGGCIELSQADFDTLAIKVGDTLKIASDDLIPWSDPDDFEYCGETFRVDAVGGNQHIYLSQPLAMAAHMSTNVRLAKATDLAIDIAELDLNDSEGFDPNINTPHLKINGAVRPFLREVNTTFGAAAHIVFQSCYKPRTQSISGINLRTSIVGRYNAYGYVLAEYGCTGGVHTDLYGSKCRHVYTTGARKISAAPEADLLLYGGVVGAVVQGIGDDCEHYAFDTHADSLRCSLDVVVKQGYRGMYASLFGCQLRGQDHLLRAEITAQSCLTVQVHGQGTGQHKIDLLYSRPDLGQGELTELLRFTNVGTGDAYCRLRLEADVMDYGRPIIESEGVDLFISDITLAYAPETDFNGAVFYHENCRIDCARLDWDMRGASVLTPRIVRQKGDGGELYVDSARIRNAPKFYAGDLNSRASAVVVINELLSDGELVVRNQSSKFDLFANRASGAVGLAATKVLENGAPQPSVIAFSVSSAAATPLQWEGRLDRTIFVELSNSAGSNATLSELTPPIFDGQELVLFTSSTVSGFTLDGSTTNVSLSAPVTIGSNESLRLFGRANTWHIG